MPDIIEQITIGGPTSLVAGDLTIDFTSSSVSGTLSTLVGGIQVPAVGLTVSSAGGVTTVNGTTALGTGVSAQFAGLNPTGATTTVTALGVPAVTVQESAAVVCYATGTHIRTAEGERTVESLKIGDIVVTASGALRSIRWIGHRSLSGSDGTSLPMQLCPVRILAGAFGIGADGEERPSRELRLSPGHTVLVNADENNEGGVLVPIMCLINGTSVARAATENVTYWHVELEGTHDILLAEGLPAESYLDWGDRAFFAEASDHALHNPDHVVPGLGARCRPVAIDGPLVETERRRLDALFAVQLAEQGQWDKADAFAWLA